MTGEGINRAVVGRSRNLEKVDTDPIYRMQLVTTLRPGESTEAVLIVPKPGVSADPLLRITVYEETISNAHTFTIWDLNEENFGVRGEWFDCRWRNDLKIYQPIGSQGLIRRVEADEDFTVIANGIIRVKIMSVELGDVYDEDQDVIVSASTDFFRATLPAEIKQGDRLLIQWFADKDPNDEVNEALSERTGRWDVISTGGESTTNVLWFVGTLTSDHLPGASGDIAVTPGTAIGSTADISSHTSAENPFGCCGCLGDAILCVVDLLDSTVRAVTVKHKLVKPLITIVINETAKKIQGVRQPMCVMMCGDEETFDIDDLEECP